MVCLSWLLSIIPYRILLVNDIDILNMAKCELWENNSHFKIQSIILHALFKRFILQIYQNNEGKKNSKKSILRNCQFAQTIFYQQDISVYKILAKSLKI